MYTAFMYILVSSNVMQPYLVKSIDKLYIAWITVYACNTVYLGFTAYTYI